MAAPGHGKAFAAAAGSTCQQEPTAGAVAGCVDGTGSGRFNHHMAAPTRATTPTMAASSTTQRRDITTPLPVGN
jgi:hypothetical protein